MDPQYFLDVHEEKIRYLLHQNDVDDLLYQNYLKPIHDKICELTSAGSKGLEYGAGQAPVLARMLERSHRLITIYDPIFWPNPEAFLQKYDFVSACEVVEHFYHPRAEFKKIRNLLNEGGSLILRTSLFHEKIDFQNWHYRRDPTHVVFYSHKTMAWIADQFNFRKIEIFDNSLIVLKS